MNLKKLMKRLCSGFMAFALVGTFVPTALAAPPAGVEIYSNHYVIMNGEISNAQLDNVALNKFTPANSAVIGNTSNETINLWVSSSDMSGDTYQSPYVKDGSGNTWYLQQIVLYNIITDRNKDQMLMDADVIATATSKEDYTFNVSDITIAPYTIDGYSWYDVCYGWTMTPPEQWGGSGQTDARTDIYCLGATLYHLLTGHNPSEPPYEIYPIRQWNPALSSGLEAVILKCTQRDPSERYQSCEELYYALEHYGELDEKYRRQQKRRAGLFAAALSLSLIFGTTALAAGNMERGLTANTYQSLMADARSGATKEEQIRLCEQAVSLEPGRADGYLELLEHVFLTAENGAVSLDREEDEELRSLLGRTDAEGRTYESLLKENAEEYGRLAYELGLAYYYYYETEGNKTYAVKWLDAAAQSQTLPGKERVRAERLGTIAGYYTQIGLIDKAGDSTVSYLDYWNQLTELTAGNLVDEDNAMTALRMYQELAGQLYTRAPEFAAAGVSREQMKEQLAGIRKHLQTDFLEVDLKEQGLEEMEQSLEQLTAQAEEQVDAVFSQPQALAEHEGV